MTIKARPEKQPERIEPKRTRAWEHPSVVIGLVLAACLIPFINEAIQTDDVLFVWTGQRIQKHPADFFGFNVNWWVSAIPMWATNYNPPLLSYFFAGLASLFGWSEIALHSGCFAIAFVAALGIYSLAKLWSGHPLLAALIAIATPAFLVSSSTLMCDVMALAFWIWALVLWERALACQSPWRFVIAGALAGFGMLTKYSGVDLLPLLFVLAVLRARRPGWWLLGLIVPLLMLAGYELITTKLYGRGLFIAAVHYARTVHAGFGGGGKASAAIGLAFAGGSWLPVLFFAPLLWQRRMFWIGGTILFGGLVPLLRYWNPDLPSQPPDLMKHWSFAIQSALLITSGVQVLLLVGVAIRRRADPVSIILALWIIGVLFFATVLNWTVNVRSFLPAVPAVAILTVRRLEAKRASFTPNARVMWPLLPAAMVSFSLVVSVSQLADADRTAAKLIIARFKPEGRHIWFEGHGAFQYYMEKLGAQPVDVERSRFRTDDAVVVPEIGIISPLPAGGVGSLEYLRHNKTPWVNVEGGTTNGTAGFFSAVFGPVPFVVQKPAQKFYAMVRVLFPFQFTSQSDNPQEVQAGYVPHFPHVSVWVEGEPPSFRGRPESQARVQQAHQLELRRDLAGAIEQYTKALEVDSNNVVALSNLGRIFATSSRPEFRNGAKARMLAEKANRLTDFRYPALMNILAAAYGETGNFSGAAEMAFKAEWLARVTGQGDLVMGSQELVKLFSSGLKVEGTQAP